MSTLFAVSSIGSNGVCIDFFGFIGGFVKFFRPLYFSALLVFALAPRLQAQAGAAAEAPRPLVLTEAIPTPGVEGRFDHFGFDRKNQLFVSALGNNTVEVIDISARTRVHSIQGIPNPQGLVYAPEVQKLFAASSQGKLYIYDGASFERIKEIDFGGDVDNLRYDPTTKRVYTG